MTAKEKVDELVFKFQFRIYSGDQPEAHKEHQSKQCALVAVDEVLLALQEVMMSQPDSEGQTLRQIIFYKAVKQEITKL